jgi:hypothetical protein
MRGNHVLAVFLGMEVGWSQWNGRYKCKQSYWISSEVNGTKIDQLLCVCQLSAAVTNTWDHQLMERKGWFWLMVLEVPVHDQIDPSFLGFWWECRMAMVRSAWQSKTAHLMARKQAKGREGWVW